jgi:hypothetical protein
MDIFLLRSKKCKKRLSHAALSFRLSVGMQQLAQSIFLGSYTKFGTNIIIWVRSDNNIGRSM